MRSAFYISDGTAITSEVFGHALLSMFPAEFEHVTIPFVETVEKAQATKKRIDDIYKKTGERPLVFSTFVNTEARDIVAESEGIDVNFLEHFVPLLEEKMGIEALPKQHRTHSIHENNYDYRIDAVNYSLANDDGSNVKDYGNADIILVGVSRSGKTPTSLYLALQYGLKAANYPFTEDDMDALKIPKFLEPHKDKLFGLTIEPERLHHIRSERRANSRYASMRQCRMEVREVEMLYKRHKIPYINSTRYSVEEISAKVMEMSGLERKKY